MEYEQLLLAITLLCQQQCERSPATMCQPACLPASVCALIILAVLACPAGKG
jgi:hypothetical protein